MLYDWNPWHLNEEAILDRQKKATLRGYSLEVETKIVLDDTSGERLLRSPYYSVSIMMVTPENKNVGHKKRIKKIIPGVFVGGFHESDFEYGGVKAQMSYIKTNEEQRKIFNDPQNSGNVHEILNNHPYWLAPDYGTCDDLSQIFKHPKAKIFLKDPARKFVLTMYPIYKKDQSPTGGWRWHKNGPYIGTKIHSANIYMMKMR